MKELDGVKVSRSHRLESSVTFGDVRARLAAIKQIVYACVSRKHIRTTVVLIHAGDTA